MTAERIGKLLNKWLNESTLLMNKSPHKRKISAFYTFNARQNIQWSHEHELFTSGNEYFNQYRENINSFSAGNTCLYCNNFIILQCLYFTSLSKRGKKRQAKTAQTKHYQQHTYRLLLSIEYIRIIRRRCSGISTL